MTPNYHVSQQFLDLLYDWRSATNKGDIKEIQRTFGELTTYVAQIEDGQGPGPSSHTRKHFSGHC